MAGASRVRQDASTSIAQCTEREFLRLPKKNTIVAAVSGKGVA